MSYFCTFNFFTSFAKFSCGEMKESCCSVYYGCSCSKRDFDWNRLKLIFWEDRPPSSFAVEEWVKPGFRLFQCTVSPETANVYSLQHWAAVYISMKEGTARAKEQGCSH